MSDRKKKQKLIIYSVKVAAAKCEGCNHQGRTCYNCYNGRFDTQDVLCDSCLNYRSRKRPPWAYN